MSKLAYNEMGEGNTVVFLHGFCETKELWKPYAKELSENFHVLAIDLPGFGKSDLTTETPTIESFADEIFQLLKFLDIHKATIIGHSLGGYIALSLAEKYPKLVTGLGLFHSTAFADDEARKDSRNKSLTFIEKYGSEKLLASLFPNFFSKESHKKYPKQIKEFIKDAEKTNVKTVSAAMIAMRDRLDKTEILQNSKVPVLFIIGKQDPLIPMEDYLQQIVLPKDAHIHFLQNVAHIGMIEAQQKTILMIEGFAIYCQSLIVND